MKRREWYVMPVLLLTFVGGGYAAVFLAMGVTLTVTHWLAEGIQWLLG